jgi:transcription antitermination factor NusG
MAAFNVGWYAIYTKVRHEKKVAQYLEGSGREYFLPTSRVLKIWTGTKRYVHLPLFPSYVFVKLKSLTDYYDSLTLPGVLNFVKIGSQIAAIRESTIHKLRAIVSNNPEQIEVLSDHLSKGKILDINSGPFKGFCCEIIEHKGRNKILVRIELLNRNVLVDVPYHSLEANFY